MRSSSLSTLALLLAGRTLGAQQSFVIPDASSVLGSAEAASAKAPAHLLYVTNRSSLPIVVYALELRSCDNVVQPCERAPVAVAIPAGGRGQVGRVEARTRTKRIVYEWTFAYRPDTADASVVATMREHGLLKRDAPGEPATNLATPAAPAASSSSGPGTIVALDANNRPVAMSERYRFKVAYGSILGSTKGMPGAPLLATGACINPAELARYERDTTITGEPAVPPTTNRTSISMPTLPPELRDSPVGTGSVVARWVVDSTGDTLPGSVQIVQSPHALLSVRVCGAVIGAHLNPGRDAAGHPVQTWVQMALRFAQ